MQQNSGRNSDLVTPSLTQSVLTDVTEAQVELTEASISELLCLYLKMNDYKL